MPITPGCQPRSASTKAASSAGSNSSLACLAAASWMLRSKVCRVAFSPSMYWANSCGPLGPIGHQQFHGQLRLAEPAGGVQPRGDLEAQVLGVQPRLAVGMSSRGDLGNAHQRGQARAWARWPGSPGRGGPRRGSRPPAARRRPRCPARPGPPLAPENPSSAGRRVWPRWPAGTGPRPVSCATPEPLSPPNG